MCSNILKLDAEIKDILPNMVSKGDEYINEKHLTYWFQNYISSSKKSMNYDFYLIEVLELLKLYEEELRKPVVINFYKRKIFPDREDNIQKIVDKYIYILSLLSINIQISPTEKTVFKCCSQPFYFLESNEFFICCESCGQRLELDNVTTNYGDCNRLIITHKNPHDKRNHFSECIDNFQGIQKYDIPEDILMKIEAHLDSYGLIFPGFSRRDRFSNVKKDHIKHILKNIGLYKKYKEDINVIYKIITDKEMPQINHLKNRLLEDFDIFDERYSQLFSISDQSAYHYCLILYQLLCSYNFPCKKTDFNFLKTAERKFTHEQKYKQVFESLGWNYQSLF